MWSTNEDVMGRRPSPGVGDELALLCLTLNHLVDAAAGGIGFEVPKAVGGAGAQAKAAVHTTGVVLVRGIQTRDGRRAHLWFSGDARTLEIVCDKECSTRG